MKLSHLLYSLIMSTLLFLSGCVSIPPYEGTQCIEGNCFDGQGVLQFASGTRITGQFEYGFPQGAVTVTKPNGESYRGEMQAGIFNGNVNINSPSAGQSNVAYRHGVPQKLKHKRGADVYVGSFNTDELGMVDLLAYSQGTYKKSTGETYKGTFAFNGRNYTFTGIAIYDRNNYSKGEFVSDEVLSSTSPLKFNPNGAHYA